MSIVEFNRRPVRYHFSQTCLDNLTPAFLNRHQEGGLCFPQRAADDAKELMVKYIHVVKPQTVSVQPQVFMWLYTKTR